MAAAIPTLSPPSLSTPSLSSPKSPLSLSLPKSPTFSLSLSLSLTPSSFKKNPFKEDYPFHESPLLLLRLLRLAVLRRDAGPARAVHAAVTKLRSRRHDDDGDVSTNIMWNSLISTYVKLGLFFDARQVFDEMPERDVVSYAALISAYAKFNQALEAVDLFLGMQKEGIVANSFSLVAILTASIRHPGSLLCPQIHALAAKLPEQFSGVHVDNALMAGYIELDCSGSAEKVFDEMPERDVTSWNTVISGAVKRGDLTRAFELFREMRRAGLVGDSFTLSSLIGGSGAEIVHAHAVKTGLELDLSVGNALMAFYTNLGSKDSVLGLFERMPERDSISWNEMIRALMASGSVGTAVGAFRRCPVKNGVVYNTLMAGFVENEEPIMALKLFIEMIEQGMEISDHTLSSAITATRKVPGACEQLHAFAAKSGGGSDDWVAAALLTAYARSNQIDSVEKIFDRWEHDKSRVIATTALLSSRSSEIGPSEVLDLVHQIARNQSRMDQIAVTAALRLAGELGIADLGHQLHGYLLKSGEPLNDTQVQNSLISMYARCGDVKGAIEVFSVMADRDVVSWNSLIGAYVLHRRGDKALSLWQAMETEGIEPDAETFRLLISAWKFSRERNISDCRHLLERAPRAANYEAAVDAIGVCGELGVAAELARSSPESHRAWAALLRRSSGELRQEAARHVLAAEPETVSDHILAANLYAAAGRWRCAEAARKKMKEKGLRKRPAQSWVVSGGKIVSFYARDKSHVRSKDINACLEVLIKEGMKLGYEPDTRFVLQEAEEFQKREFVFTHSAKLAVAYGHMVEPPGRLVRVVKNVRICGDCHDFLKVFSVITGREVLLRDASGFHHLSHGRCSCSDRW